MVHLFGCRHEETFSIGVLIWILRKKEQNRNKFERKESRIVAEFVPSTCVHVRVYVCGWQANLFSFTSVSINWGSEVFQWVFYLEKYNWDDLNFLNRLQDEIIWKFYKVGKNREPFARDSQFIFIVLKLILLYSHDFWVCLGDQLTTLNFIARIKILKCSHQMFSIRNQIDSINFYIQ